MINHPFDLAISRNNRWVAVGAVIYQFDGGTLTFFQEVGDCYDVKLSAEGDFIFCYDRPYELVIYKHSSEILPDWAIAVIPIASVCLILIVCSVFCIRR